MRPLMFTLLQYLPALPGDYALELHLSFWYAKAQSLGPGLSLNIMSPIRVVGCKRCNSLCVSCSSTYLRRPWRAMVAR